MKTYKHRKCWMNWETLDLCHRLLAVTLGLKLGQMHVGAFFKNVAKCWDCDLVSYGLGIMILHYKDTNINIFVA